MPWAVAAMAAAAPPAAAEPLGRPNDDADASWTSPPWGPHRLVPEAERWRRTREVHDKLRRRVDELEAALEAERRKRKEVEMQATTDVEKWRTAARLMEIDRDAFDKMAKTAVVDSMAKVNNHKWDCIEQVTDYEARIRALERTVEEERIAHNEELQRYAQLLHQTQDDCEARVQDVLRQRDEAVAAAKKRAEEAEEAAVAAQRRAEEEVHTNRQRETRHVADVRQMTGERVRGCEEHRRDEVEQLRQRTAQQRAEMEEKLDLNDQQKATALKEARRHLTAMEHDSKDWGEAYAVDFEMKAVHLREYQERQRAQNKAVASHHKALLDTEKTLHGRTMERTMGRLVRHMQMSDADTRGSETPTKDFLRTYPLPMPTARDGAPLSAREGGGVGFGGTLKHAGGVLVSDGVSGASD